MNKNITGWISVFNFLKIFALMVAVIETMIFYNFTGKGENQIWLIWLYGFTYLLSIYFIIYFIKEKSIKWVLFAPVVLLPLLIVTGGYMATIIILSLPVGLYFIVTVLIVIIKDYDRNFKVLPESSVFVFIMYLLFYVFMRVFEVYFISEFFMGLVGLASALMASIILKKIFSEEFEKKNLFVSSFVVVVVLILTAYVFFTSVGVVFVSDPVSVDRIIEKTQNNGITVEKHEVDHGALASESFYTKTSRRYFVIFEKVEYSNYRR